jgi:hypothetical protein
MHGWITVCNCIKGTGKCQKKVCKGECPSRFSMEMLNNGRACYGRRWKKIGKMSVPRREAM